MADLSQLGAVLVGCRVVTRDQWDRAAEEAGDDLDEILATLATGRPHWWDHSPPAPPGLTDYQRAVIRARAEDGDLAQLRRDLALNQFLLLSKLGQGGQGEVFRARQINPPRYAAVKTLVRDTESRRRRFEQEARAMMRVQHPAVARFYLYERVRDAAGEPTDEYLIAMEFVNGMVLHRLVQKGGPVPWAFAAQWAAGLLGGLAAIHKSGFVHGDVKPENIMALGPAPGPGVSPEATAAKLLDFGAVRMVGGDDDPDRRRTFVGTPEYAPPEQWKGEVLAASDLYALGGAVLYMITGKCPYQKPRRDAAAYRESHVNEPVPDLAALAPGVPPELSRLVGRMMAKDPDDRGTAAELAEEFRKLVPRTSKTAPPATPPPRPKPAAVPPAAVAAPRPSAPSKVPEPESRNPIYRGVDAVLAILERIFIPGYHRPLPGNEPSIPERVMALLRRPLVLLMLLVAAVILVLWMR